MHPILIILLIPVALWLGRALLVGLVLFWGTGGFDQRRRP